MTFGVPANPPPRRALPILDYAPPERHPMPDWAVLLLTYIVVIAVVFGGMFLFGVMFVLWTFRDFSVPG